MKKIKSYLDNQMKIFKFYLDNQMNFNDYYFVLLATYKNKTIIISKNDKLNTKLFYFPIF